MITATKTASAVLMKSVRVESGICTPFHLCPNVLWEPSDSRLHRALIFRSCEHAFVTAQGSPHGRFRRALDRGNVTEALSAASEPHFVSLAEALELTLLLAEGEPEKYERAAACWHSRFGQEVPHVDLRESLAVLALLAAIPANRLAASAVAELLSRGRSCGRIAEALVRWSRAA